ncbi:hypothetical protein [Actinoplanes sp. NPDC051859]|uniref:hypothetical protein n=1 Tax=Actinoplanes sp. NPDC051859 TaxID=3363909 RepID=UPI0037AF1DA3
MPPVHTAQPASRTHASALAERVLEGDTSITAEQLTAAHGADELAGLQAEAAARNAEASAHVGRVAAYRELAERAAAFAGQDSNAVTEAFDQALTALTKLWELAEQHDAAFAQLHTEATDLAALAEQNGETEELSAAGIRDVSMWGFATPTASGPMRTHRRAGAARVVAHTTAVLLHQQRAQRLAAGARGMEWEPELHVGNYSRACREAFPDLPDAHDL